MLKLKSYKTLLFTALTLTTLHAGAEVTVSEGYVRAVPPGQMNSAAFMQLSNDANDQAALVAGSSSAAKVVELHNHTNNNGVMQMRKVEQITVPANGMTALQPGGYHVMLIGLSKDLVVGDNVDLQLEFADGSTQALQLPVQKVMPMKHSHGHGHSHHH